MKPPTGATPEPVTCLVGWHAAIRPIVDKARIVAAPIRLRIIIVIVPVLPLSGLHCLGWPACDCLLPPLLRAIAQQGDFDRRTTSRHALPKQLHGAVAVRGAKLDELMNPSMVKSSIIIRFLLMAPDRFAASKASIKD